MIAMAVHRGECRDCELLKAGAAQAHDPKPSHMVLLCPAAARTMQADVFSFGVMMYEVRGVQQGWGKD